MTISMSCGHDIIVQQQKWQVTSRVSTQSQMCWARELIKADKYYVQASLLDWIDGGQQTVPPYYQHPVDGGGLAAEREGRCKWT